MTAKHWLSRARWLDGEIHDKLLQRQTAYDSLTRITQNYDGDGAQNTKDPHKFDRLAEYDALLDKLTDEYVADLKEITEIIAKLHDDRQRRVLTLYYTVKDKATNRPLTWEQVAVELHYSYKQVRRYHAKALYEIDKLLEDVL